MLRSPALVVAAFLWCGGVWFVHATLAGVACDADSPACAFTYQKNGSYQGLLVNSLGQPLANTNVTVAFASLRETAPGVAGFSTDGSGKYCFVWAFERGVPSAYVSGHYIGRLTADWQPLTDRESPADCQRVAEGIPWNRANNLKSSPQYRSVVVLLAAAMAVLLAAFLVTREPLARRLRWLGVGLAAIGTAAMALVWIA